MRHVFIINPVAGKGKAIEYEKKIREIFKEMDEPYEIFFTKGVGHATEIVKEVTSKEPCVCYSIGGDGTLNEVLNGVVNTESILAVIPSGSGNDFARTLYSDFDKINFLEDTIKGKDISIDVGKINGRYFLNISSVGFDAEVADNARFFKKQKFISGSLAYALAVVKTLFTFKGMDASIEGAEGIIKDKMYLIAIANGKWYGGGIKIAPLADVSDGVFDVYAIKKPKIFTIIRALPLVVRGKDTSGVREIKYKKWKRLTVKCENEETINIDGELIKAKEIDLEIIPNGVKVKVPKEHKALFSA